MRGEPPTSGPPPEAGGVSTLITLWNRRRSRHLVEHPGQATQETSSSSPSSIRSSLSSTRSITPPSWVRRRRGQQLDIMRLPEKLSPTSEDLAFIEEVEHRQRTEEPPSSTTSTPTRSPSPPAANRERCLLAAPSTCSAGKAQESDGGLSGQAPSEQSPDPQQEGPVRREMALVAAEVRYRDSWQLLSREEAKRRRVGRGEATPLVEYIEVPESLDENKVARGQHPDAASPR